MAVTWTRGPRDRYPVAHVNVSLSYRDVEQLLGRDTEGRGLEAVVAELVHADLDLEKMLEGRLSIATDGDGPLADGRPVRVPPAQRRRSSFEIPCDPPAHLSPAPGEAETGTGDDPLPTRWRSHTVWHYSKLDQPDGPIEQG